MPEQEEHGPWERFAKKPPVAKAPTEEHGPWEKFGKPPKAAEAKPAPTPKPAAGVSTMPKERQSFTAQHPFYAGVARGAGLDPEAMHAAFQEGGAKAQWAQAGQEMLDNLRHFGISILKDPFKMSEVVEAPASAVESGAKKVGTALVEDPMGSEAQRQHLLGGGGELLSAISGVLGGAEGVERIRGGVAVADGAVKAAHDIATKTGKDAGEAASTAAKFSKGVPSRILHRRVFEDMYIHAKGLDIGKKVGAAAKEIHNEIETHAGGIATQIDTKIPTGVVDATAEAALVEKEFKELVKTPGAVKPVLIDMVKNAKATPSGMWSWEKVRQFRSTVGRSIEQTVGPQKAVLTRVYKDLTNQLKGAAYKYGLGKSWEQYNKLAEMVDRQHGDIIDDLRSAQSGQEVAAKLSKDVGRTTELSNNLSKYGLDPKEVTKFAKQSKAILKDRDMWNRSVFRIAYGTKGGFLGILLGHMAGAPWMVSMGTGVGIGLATSYLTKLARVMRMSPDVIEHMMQEREIPGKLKFEPGQFPGGEAPKAPEPKPAPLPEPGTKKTARQSLEDYFAGRGEKKPPRLLPSAEAPKEEAPKAAEVKKAAEGEHGTGKLATQAKARERVSRARAVAKRTKESEASEAVARAQAQGLDVSQIGIPELEEYVRTKNPTAFSGLQKMRRAKGIPDTDYIEALKYYTLESLEEK